MARVLQHNRLDVVSLAALAALACQWVEGGRAEDPRDVYCLAGVLRARGAVRPVGGALPPRWSTGDAGPVRVPALLRLAARAKRSGDFSVALPCGRRRRSAATGGRCASWRVHHEHRSRDLEKALALVDRGLDQVLGAPGRARARGLRLPPPPRAADGQAAARSSAGIA